MSMGNRENVMKSVAMNISSFEWVWGCIKISTTNKGNSRGIKKITNIKMYVNFVKKKLIT